MKDILDKQVTEHLKRLNPWWESGVLDTYSAKLRPRAYLQQVLGLLHDASCDVCGTVWAASCR